MSALFTFPAQRALDDSGNVMPGAKLYFYETGTSTLKTVYQDADLNTAHSNPVISDAFGEFDAIWLDTSDGRYTVTLTSSAGVQQWSADDVGDVLEQEAVGAALWPQTAAETAAGVTIVHAHYAPGDARRYGAIADGVEDDAVAIQAALDQNAEGGAPVTLPAGTLAFGSTLTLTTGSTILGAGYYKTVLSYTGTGTALASDTPTVRTYGVILQDFKVQDAGTGSLGINLGSVSMASLQNVVVDGFTTGISLTGSNGYCVYNRFINVMAQNCTTGWVIGGTGSNSNTLAYCRTNICTTGVDITDSNHTSLEHCQLENGTTAVKITSTTNALADRNTIMGCRFEGYTTNVNITSSFVRETALVANHHVTGTNVDSGTRTMAVDIFGTTGPAINFDCARLSTATGHFRFTRSNNAHLAGDVLDSTATPAMVVADTVSSTGTPVTLQIETARDTGYFLRGMRSSTSYYELLSTGQVKKQLIRNGTTAPSTSANYIGELYVDRTNAKAYFAKSAGSGAADWFAVN